MNFSTETERERSLGDEIKIGEEKSWKYRVFQ